jgi:DNA-directed RNA polymerase II subunit RPB1
MLDKGTVGNTAGGVIHTIWLDEGPEAAARFLSQSQKIIHNWIIIHGFSVGASDIFPDEECQNLVR